MRSMIFVPMGHTAYHHVGSDDASAAAPAPAAPAPPADRADGWRLAVLALEAGAVYHGYKRNNSVLWAIAWGVAADFAPVITAAVAAAQGFGRKKGG